MRIAFDIDGVCVDVMSEVVPYVLRKTSVDVSKTPFHRIERAYEDVPSKIVWEGVDEAIRKWKTIRIYPGVTDFIQKLYARNKKSIYFVTSRPRRYAHNTHRVIDRVCGDVPYTITFAKGAENKGKYLKDYTYFVEDRRRTAIELAAQGYVVFLPDRPWNQMVNPVVRNIIRLDNGVSDLNFYL